jgi:enoyl-CoA hydratase/carnithine racemase
VEDAECGELRCKSYGDLVVLDLVTRPADAAAAAQTAMDLADMCHRIALDERVRVVVFSFDGRMDAWPTLDVAPTGGSQRFSLADPIAGLKQPVIAAIRGDALGSGLEIALACDIRVGTENSRFGLTQIGQGCLNSNPAGMHALRWRDPAAAAFDRTGQSDADASDGRRDRCRRSLPFGARPSGRSAREPDAGGACNGPRDGGEIPIVAQLR